MRRNRKIRKMEPWYRRLFERIKENRNRINRGTTEPKILENPFISRAYDKIMRNHRNHVLGMCLSGIIGGTFLFLIWDALCQAVLGVSSREWLGRGMDQILTSLFFGLSFCGYGYVENTVFHSMDHVLLKYWTCPFCHRGLPYKVEISQNIGNERFHLLPGAVEDWPLLREAAQHPSGRKTYRREMMLLWGSGLWYDDPTGFK